MGGRPYDERMVGDTAVIRAATWNVWWLFGERWHERAEGIVETLETWHPDIIGLQEAWAFGDRTQPDALAEELTMHPAFVEPGLPPVPEPVEHPDQIGVRIGLGLLSRWPITSVETHPMPSADRGLVALRARIQHPLGPLHVVVGVTSWEPERLDERAAQLEALGDLVCDPALDGRLPVLLLADLNADLDAPDTRRLRERLVDTWGDVNGESVDPRTYGASNRFASSEATLQYNRRIDHVMARAGEPGAPVMVAGSWIVRDEPGGIPPSDHYAVVTDLAV
jgi:endonuclease/exonuclease/phosphatase family metal-dependent hydrolase